MEKLLKRSRKRTFEAIAAKLPAETQMYVPKIEATLRKRENRAFADLKFPTATESPEHPTISSEEK